MTQGRSWIVIALLAGATPAAAQGSASDGEWAMPARDFAATRYSPLRDIRAANASRLKAAWSFSSGVLGGHEGQPLVVGSTMYVVTPWPNVVYAFDLTKEGYPLRWKYRPEVSGAAIGIACCDVVNRGASYAEGKLVYNLLDGHTVALDAATGRELWKTRVADMGKGETTPMAPLIVKDRVIVGTAGGEFGVRGWVKGLDLATGRIAWTGYNTGPDDEVLVKPGSFRAFYEKDHQLALTSWEGETWQRGGAPVWGWLSYDAELDLVYYGTGNPAPWNADERKGDNRWATSVMARRPGDGSLVWAYQFTPHDMWDYDATQELILADLTIGGKARKALVQFNKNGFVYVLDRATGEVLSAKAYVPVNWATGVDLKTGRPILDTAKVTGAARGTVTDICPTLEGGKNQQPAAFSPRTRLFYVSTSNMCMDYTVWQPAYIPGTPYIGASVPYKAGPGGNLGAFIAWDPVKGERVWEIKEPYPAWSGALVTAGDVVFYGTLDGWLKVADARTGKLLWKFKVGSGVIGNPISFRGPDGKQYVAVYAGFGGDWGLLSGDVRSDDPHDVREPASFMTDIARHTSQGGIVWLFSL